MLLDDARSVKLGTTTVHRMMKEGFEVWPKTPVALAAGATRWDTVVLRITPPMVAADTYVIKRDGTQIHEGLELFWIDMYPDSALLPSTTYNYTVDAMDNGAVRSTGSASVTTPARADMGLVVASSRWDTTTSTWTDTSAGSIDEYFLQRTGTTGVSLPITTASYTESVLFPSTAYTYTLQAKRDGVVISTDTADVTTAAYAVPVITLTSPDYSTMQIRWTASTEGTVDWYELHRCAPGVEDWSLLESEPAADKARDEGGLAENRTYQYLVRSFRGGKPPPNGSGVQIGGDATAQSTTRTRSWGTAEGGPAPGYGAYGKTTTAVYDVEGNQINLPYNSTVYSMKSWVWGYGQNARVEPKFGGISFGIEYIIPPGQNWNYFATNIYYSSGVKTSGMRLGGSNWGYAEWTGWVAQNNYIMPGIYSHTTNGVAYGGYICTHSVSYWHYPTLADQPQMRDVPWWNESLAERATHTTTWTDEETGEITKVLIKDYLTDEILVAWEQGVEA